MDAIEFRETKIVLIEESFGGLSMSEFPISYDELKQYEIRLDANGDAGLDRLVSGGKEENPRLNLDALSSTDMEVRKIEQDSTDGASGKQVTTGVELKSQAESMPRVPEVTVFKDDTRERFYTRLKNNPDSQPAAIRRVIRNKGEMTKRQLANWIEKNGYEPSAGSFNECLLVLDEVTDDIDRHGRGDDQRLIWING